MTPGMVTQINRIMPAARRRFAKWGSRYRGPNWDDDLFMGKLAELAFAELIGGKWTGNDSGAIDVLPNWDVKWTRAGEWLRVSDERGKDSILYVAATGGRDEIWFMGFALGKNVRDRGRPDRYEKDPGMMLDIAGLHRLPEAPKFHKEVLLIDAPTIHTSP